MARKSSSALPHVIIYSDGAFSGKYNAGAWASYMTCGHHDLILGAYVEETTNNRMELQAVISALSQLVIPCEVTLYSDSQYVVNGMNQWIYGWMKNGWVSSKGQSVVNIDLWKQIVDLKKKHKIKAMWVRGHNGNPGNELCDEIALTLQHIHGGYRRTG